MHLKLKMKCMKKDTMNPTFQDMSSIHNQNKENIFIQINSNVVLTRKRNRVHSKWDCKRARINDRASQHDKKRKGFNEIRMHKESKTVNALMNDRISIKWIKMKFMQM